MNKAPRFLKEYAAYQKKSISEKFPLMRSDYKQDIIDSIDRAEYLYIRGFITIDEAMRIIGGDYAADLSNEDLGLE